MTEHEQTWNVLADLVDNLTYNDGSRFVLHREDADNYAVLYAYLHENWRRWVYEQLCSAALHEVGE